MSDEEVNRRLTNIEDELHEFRKETRDEIESLKMALAKYRGAAGAVLLLVAIVVSGAKMLWGLVKEHITWH